MNKIAESLAGATSYPNQLRIILSGKNLDRETVAGSFHNQKEPTFNITRGRYRNHENHNAMPSTAVQYHATERMMSPLAASRHQQLPRFGWENANERGAFDMQALTRSLPQQHQRNARSMPTIKESAAGVMNGFSGSFGDFATDNRRASFLAEGYNMHSGYRPVEWNKFDSMNTSQTMAHDTTINNSADHGQNYGGFNSVSLPYQPSHAMPWAAQSPSQPQATNSPYGLSTMAMAQGTGPLASMVMSSPALKPSNMLQREQGILPPLTEGPNGNDGPLTKTREEEEVPNEENCSLVCKNPLLDPNLCVRVQVFSKEIYANFLQWIKNIAPTMTPRLFFQMIRCGAVYALHIYPPTGQHTTQAAKLIFKRPSSAAAFLQQANTAAGMRPHGRRLKVNYNRNGVREYVGSKTRVIRILGPSREMLFPVWDAYFRGLCLFDYDDVLDPGCDIGGKAIIEFRFMRIDAQSQMIHKEITDNPQLQRFRAYFAPDPCGN